MVAPVPSRSSLLIRLLLSTGASMVLLPGVLLLTAGTWHWPQVWIFALLGLVAWFGVIGLDHRYRWSCVPVWLQIVGAAGIAGSLIVTAFVFRANSFAAPVVKIQTERQHSIADTGPYAVVRHPMYSGAILFLLGAPLLLGSWYTLIASLLVVIILGARAVGEERLLTTELDGYPEYAARVRYRLIAYIW